MVNAGTSRIILHYLKAVRAAGTRDVKAAMAEMREMPIHDAFAENGALREDGRMVHSTYLFEVKKPEESKGTWDYYTGDQASRP